MDVTSVAKRDLTWITQLIRYRILVNENQEKVAAFGLCHFTLYSRCVVKVSSAVLLIGFFKFSPVAIEYSLH